MTLWICDNRNHGVSRAEQLVDVETPGLQGAAKVAPGRHVRMACPECRSEGKPGWVSVFVVEP